MERAADPRRATVRWVAAFALIAGLIAVPATHDVGQAATTTPVMQDSRLSPAQIAGWFHEQGTSGYAAAVPVEFLAAYFIYEGDAEGVAGDIAFAQAVHETNYFRYGGQVPASHNNYGGIGATDDGAAGAQFRSPRIGVRAQIQHLRAYADPTVTQNNLAYPLESPRFHLVTPKGKNPNWEDFGGPGTWATDPNYSEKVLRIYASMRAYGNANPQLQGRWMFSDVAAGSTFEHDIVAIAIEDITRGCGGDRYCPKQAVTRAEMASFLRRAAGLPRSDVNRFTDVSSSNVHRRDINALAEAGITAGCNPPRNDRFCPDAPVTREQMASFLVRALDDLAPSNTGRFTDVSSSNTHWRNINALGATNIARGCNPPANTRFCPNDFVTREQMAAFLVRAFELTQDNHSGFVDVSSSNTFVNDIRKIAAVGITRGCNPPANDRYCPKSNVTRGQMAAFINRADKLTGS